MDIRPYQSGDEFEQLKIYNTSASTLPKFKPATLLEIQRRTSARDFKPAMRLYALESGRVVGYCTWQPNGRVAYPWTLPTYEAAAAPLFAQTLQAMKAHGVPRAFSAYRKDWPTITDFFLNNGFSLKREMINYVMAMENMPTASARISSGVTAATLDDIPAILALDPTVFRATTPEALKEAIWNNPFFGPESLFVMRNKGDRKPLAAGIFITNNVYADPRVVDAGMPCFRLGAFGTEGMTTKRIKGLFSFVTKPDRNVFTMGMDLLSYAMNMLDDDDDIPSYGAQVASDAPALAAFYQKMFERQGSFPVYERELN